LGNAPPKPVVLQDIYRSVSGSAKPAVIVPPPISSPCSTSSQANSGYRNSNSIENSEEPMPKSQLLPLQPLTKIDFRNLRFSGRSGGRPNRHRLQTDNPTCAGRERGL